MDKFKLITPKGTYWSCILTDHGYSKNRPAGIDFNIKRTNNQITEKIKGVSGNHYKTITQQIDDFGDAMLKITTITPEKETFRPLKSIQRITKDGYYSTVRLVDNEIVGGYEMVPFVRKFAEGFKGKLQKFALKIACDANGCERPVLRDVGARLLKLAK